MVHNLDIKHHLWTLLHFIDLDPLKFSAMDQDEPLPNEIAEFFTPKEFSELSEYEKLQLRNLCLNYEFLSRHGKRTVLLILIRPFPWNLFRTNTFKENLFNHVCFVWYFLYILIHIFMDITFVWPDQASYNSTSKYNVWLVCLKK